MRILVTGGTGFVGKFAVRELVAAGHEVRALVRDAERAQSILGPSVELSVGSALEAAAVGRALDGCDALLHAAAVYSYDRRDAARVSADTPALARSVLGAALAANVSRVVDIASTVVFTTNADLVALPTRLAASGDHTWGDPYVRAKVGAERTGLELETRGLHRVTLHPSLVLGPDDAGPGNSGRTVIALLRNRMTTNARCGWVDVRDVASAIVAALDLPAGTHAIISSTSMSYRELAPLLEHLTGRTRRRFFAPAGMIRVMARTNDVLGGRLADLPKAGALEYALTSPPIDGSSGQALMGRPYRPLEETLTDSIRWWAANGTIDRELAGRLVQ